jgi:hypothetical protein
MRRTASIAVAALCLAVLGTVISAHWRGKNRSEPFPLPAPSIMDARSEERIAAVPNRAVVALIAHGWHASGYEDTTTIKGRKLSMELTLKGLLRTLSRRCALHIYFVVGIEDEQRIRQFLAGAGGPTSGSPVSFSFVPLDEPQLALWLAAIGHAPSHRTGAAGNIKFFYPLMFPKEVKMLMLDTDVLIGRDICLLWDEFLSFPDDALFGFVPQKPKVHPHADNEFNAGVGLLHLERMRRADWLLLARNAIDHWQERRMHPPCCAHGDQSVFHMIRFMRPEALRLLPRWWNMNKCHRYQNFDRNPPGSFVGIVHLGCCKMCTRAKLWPRWVALLDEIERFNISGPRASLTELATVSCGEGRIVLLNTPCT